MPRRTRGQLPLARPRSDPRFIGENFVRNLAIVEEVTRIGAEIGATPAQTALAWLLTRGDDIAPIPGTRRVARVERIPPPTSSN